MRKFIAFIVLVFGLVLVPSVAVAEPVLSGQFTVHFGRGGGVSNEPCVPETFCGTGTLVGFGQATDTVEFTNFEPIEGTSCFAVMFDELIELADGSGTLILLSEGTFCSPGGSGEAPAAPQDYGHPSRLTATFTVAGEDSTGVFAGAIGSGEKSVTFAGDVATIQLSGSVAFTD